MTNDLALLLKTARSIETCPAPVVAANFAEILHLRAQARPDDLAYVFLGFGRSPDVIRTYGELDAEARRIASALRGRGLTDSNVILAYPSAREFIEAFFGCLYAGCVAVPALPPDDERETKRLLGIIRDCEPALVLTTAEEVSVLVDYLSAFNFSHVPCMTAGALNPAETSLNLGEIAPTQIAFLQYTSGSTAEPRGVMVSHENLLHNEEVIALNFRSREQRWLGCSWLPHYHDMGLIGGILHPIYIGRPIILYSSSDFLQHPMRWLKLISDFGITATGAPNFAYDLCLRRSKRFDLSTLNLSSWTLAFNGAEPVHYETVSKFVERFAACGLSPDAVCAGYGLAEATLMATARRRGETTVSVEANYDSIVRGRMASAQPNSPVITLVGNGLTERDDGVEVRIFDPETGRRMETNEIGEICLRGRSIAGGYWHKPNLNAQLFNAYAESGVDRGFLRTGDLGFIDKQGELFVTGRLKDVVIWNGANYYPQDIEHAISETCDGIRSGRIAVFSVDADGENGVFVVCEAAGAVNDSLATAIRDACAKKIGLPLAGVFFITKGSIPRTSSGKIRRSECRRRLFDGLFSLVHEWSLPHWREPIDRYVRRNAAVRATTVVM